MFREIFGETLEGRLSRGAYFKYMALLSVFVLLIVLYAASTMFLEQQSVQFDWRDLRNLQTVPQFDLWGRVTYEVMAFGAIILFANFNIAVKRIRDVGLPVHWVLLAFFFTYAFSPGLFFVVLELSMLLLTALPSDSLAELGVV